MGKTGENIFALGKIKCLIHLVHDPKTLFPWNNWERKSTSVENERYKPQRRQPSKCPCILWYMNIEAKGFPFWLK